MRRRDDRGTTAVLVAVLSVVLFASAALAVDLGNAWARKRSVQKQVDVSAIAAGAWLPMTAANAGIIASHAADFLNDNRASGQPAVTPAQLLDGDAADGEVTFQDSAGHACSDNCIRMTVVTPSARVDFGFAQVLGANHTDVQRSATVQVQSALPPSEKLIPFWLPSGCGYGPADADTTQGTPPPAPPPSSPTATDTSSAAAPAPSTVPIAPVGTHTLSGPSYSTAVGTTLTVDQYVVGGIQPSTDRASLRFVSPDGTIYRDYAAQTNPGKGSFQVPAFQIGTEITTTPGLWHVYALVDRNKSTSYSTTSVTFEVRPPTEPTGGATATASATASATSVPVGCVGQDRGNFGQLDSPRADGAAGQTRLARNIAGGLDHLLAPFVLPAGQTMTKTCVEGGHGFIAGAEPDNVSSSSPPRNCIVGDTGNDGPALYDGLITGTGSLRGRLDVANGSTTCPSRTDLSLGGKVLNNDVLSCFLRNGHTLVDITQATGVDQTMLDPSVIASPRFVWLPVVAATDRAQKDFQPIVDFVPAFITDEDQTTPATATNGLDVNGNSVKVLRVFTFNKAALPIDEKSSTVAYDPTLARSIVRLVG